MPIVSALTAFVLGVFSPLATKLVEARLGGDQLVDAVRADDAIRVSALDYSVFFTGVPFGFKDDLALTAEEKATLAVRPADVVGSQESIDRWDSYQRLVTRHDGVPVETARYKIALSGRRDQPVYVKNVRVEVLEKQAPLAGTIICDGPQGEDDSVPMDVNLDEASPVLRIPEDAEQRAGQPYFASKSITLPKGEVTTIELIASTLKSHVKFRLIADYEVGDVRGSKTIDNQGEPFELTAYAGTAGKLLDERYRDLSAYRTAWVGSTSLNGWREVKKPRTEEC